MQMQEIDRTVELTDEELDAVAGGALDFSFNTSSSVTGTGVTSGTITFKSSADASIKLT
jgi:hypothetical protein